MIAPYDGLCVRRCEMQNEVSWTMGNLTFCEQAICQGLSVHASLPRKTSMACLQI